MNALIFFPDEVSADGVAVIRGERAARVNREHALTPGITITAAVRGGHIGSATLEAVSPTEIRCRVRFDREPPPRVDVELIVAVPRPQTVKKIIHVAVTLGLQRLHFIRTLHTVKSYLQSSVLTPEAIEEEVVRGLAQAVDSRAPTIEIHRSFESFVEGVVPTIVANERGCVLADTHAAPRIGAAVFPSLKKAALAVGPESGWSDFERERFIHHGFRAVSLGPRMLRVEVAATMGLAELGVVLGRFDREG